MEPAAPDNDARHKGGKQKCHSLPVDRGWAWVVLAAFLASCLLRIGYHKSFGIVFLGLLRTLDSSVTATSVVIAFNAIGFSIGGLLTLTILMPVVSVRKCVVLGGLVTVAGVILTIVSDRLIVIILAQGFLVGFGHMILYLPGQTLMTMYFWQKRVLAMKIVNIGSNFGALAFPPLLHFLIAEYDLNGCLLIVSAILLNFVVCGALMRPLHLKGEVHAEDDLIEEQMKDKDVMECEEEEVPEDIQQNGYMGRRRLSQTAMVLLEIEKDVNNLEPFLEKSLEHDVELPVRDHYATVTSNRDAMAVFSATPFSAGRRNDSEPNISQSSNLAPVPSQGPSYSDFLKPDAIASSDMTPYGFDDDDDEDEGASASPKFSATKRAPSGAAEDAGTGSKRAELTPLLLPDAEALDALDREAGEEVPRSPTSLSGEQGGTQIAALCILADPSLQTVSLSSRASQGKLHSSAPALGAATFEVLEVVDASHQPPASKAKTSWASLEGCWEKIAAKDLVDKKMFRDSRFYVILSQSLLALLPTNLMLVYLPAFASERGMTDLQGALLLMLVAVCSIIAKVITGLLLDKQKATSTSIVIVSMMVMGTAGILAPLCTQFWMFLIFSAAFGFVVDTYYGHITLLAEDFFGPDKLDQVVVQTLIFEAMSLAVGSPFCGLIRDSTGKFDNVYHFLGGCAIVAASVVLVDRYGASKNLEEEVNSADDRNVSVGKV